MSKVRPRDSMISVLIVDDHPILRQGVIEVLKDQPDLVICGQASDVPTALQLMEQHKPDVVIVDLCLRNGSGIDLIREVSRRWPESAILAFTMLGEPFYAERALRAGAKGYVTKGEPCTRLIAGIRKVAQGEIFVRDDLAGQVVDKMVGGRPSDRPSVGRLSNREFQVFEMIGQGLRTRQIAGKLNVSIKTVDAHRENIKNKLKLKNATELLKTAIQWVQFESRRQG